MGNIKWSENNIMEENYYHNGILLKDLLNIYEKIN
jgi:hypothetical protein